MGAAISSASTQSRPAVVELFHPAQAAKWGRHASRGDVGPRGCINGPSADTPGMTVAHDAIVIGAGVIGTSIAYHLAAFGARDVVVLDRAQIGSGTSSQSSGILRTHYSVPENVELAKRSWQVFDSFAAYLGDEEASAGLVKCGYLIAAPEGPKLAPLRAGLLAQQAKGIAVQLLSPQEAALRLPICRFDDAALIGFEPEAGFADAYLVASGFARAARRRGVKIIE